MMRLAKVFLVALFITYHLTGISFVTGYGVEQFHKPQRMSDLLSSGSNDFGLDVVRQTSNLQNVFISPISISMLMGFLYSGANGTSAEEIKNVMKFPPAVYKGFKEILDVIKSPEGLKTSKLDYSLEMANAMFVDDSFNIRPIFKDESRQYYEAAVESISFSSYPLKAVESINGWVALKTKNKIMKLLEEPLDPLTKLFLLNAVYFKGTWKIQFNQRYTKPDIFYNNGVVPKTVPMMRKKGKQMYYFDTNLQTHVLELPYSGEDIKMLLLLPEKLDGLSDIEPYLSNDMLTKFSSNLEEVLVQIILPKFSLTEEYDLMLVLKNMGISDIFNADISDFSGITPKQGLYVTKAIHKCAIEVNEEGSEAAAVTGVTLQARTEELFVTQFIVDHPFMFFIRHSKLNLTLFIGKVLKL